MILSEYDRNGNGRLEPAEVASLKAGAFSYLKNYGYFAHIKIDGKSFQVKYIQEFSAKSKDSQLVYEFLVPCHIRAVDTFKEVLLSIYDDTYYSAVLLAKPAVGFQNHQNFEIEHRIERDRNEAFYYGQVYPEVIAMRFKRKNG